MLGSVEITRDLDWYLYHEKNIEYQHLSVASSTKFCTAFSYCAEIYITCTGENSKNKIKGYIVFYQNLLRRYSPKNIYIVKIILTYYIK